MRAFVLATLASAAAAAPRMSTVHLEHADTLLGRCHAAMPSVSDPSYFANYINVHKDGAVPMDDSYSLEVRFPYAAWMGEESTISSWFLGSWYPGFVDSGEVVLQIGSVRDSEFAPHNSHVFALRFHGKTNDTTTLPVTASLILDIYVDSVLATGFHEIGVASCDETFTAYPTPTGSLGTNVLAKVWDTKPLCDDQHIRLAMAVHAHAAINFVEQKTLDSTFDPDTVLEITGMPHSGSMIPTAVSAVEYSTDGGSSKSTWTTCTGGDMFTCSVPILDVGVWGQQASMIWLRLDNADGSDGIQYEISARAVLPGPPRTEYPGVAMSIVPVKCLPAPKACVNARPYDAYGTTDGGSSEMCLYGQDGDECTLTGCAYTIPQMFYGKLVPATATLTCKNGNWVGAPRGCVYDSSVTDGTFACAPKHFDGYLISGTTIAASEGAMATAAGCEVGYDEDPAVAGAFGMLTCTNGEWVGQVQGCTLMGSEARPCPTMSAIAYDFTCTNGHMHGSLCRPGGCSTGHSLSDDMVPANGTKQCINGIWHGMFMGCETAPGATPATCDTDVSASLPAGYTVVPMSSCTGSSSYDSFTDCELQCDSGAAYGGSAQGHATCYDGAWDVSVYGCEKQCTLPTSVCDAGAMVGNVVVNGVYADQGPDDVCVLQSRGRFQLWSASCAPGYVSTGEARSLKPAVCIDGTLYGGFASTTPMCEPEVSTPQRECSCGADGMAAGIATEIRSGLHRDSSYVAGTNEWVCSRVSNFVTCRCQCA